MYNACTDFIYMVRTPPWENDEDPPLGPPECLQIVMSVMIHWLQCQNRQILSFINVKFYLDFILTFPR